MNYKCFIPLIFTIIFSGCFMDGTVDTDYQAPMSNEEFQQTLIDVHDDAQNVVVGYNGTDTESSVTLNLNLPVTGESGSVISWISSNETVISTSGVVTRQVGNTTVYLTAIATKHDLSSSKAFTLTVLSL